MMVNSPKQRTPRTSEVEARVLEMARREADRQARRIPWQRLLEARQQYIEWNAFSLWARAIAEAEGCAPAWLKKVVEERCPGLLGSDRSSEITHQDPLLYRRILEWFETNVLAQAKEEGWLRAVTFHAVRDPECVRDWAYWQHSEAQWKRQRPSAYPSFEEWRRSSEQCADQVLDALEMKEDKRQIIKAVRVAGPGRLEAAVAQFMEWEAFTYWLRSLLESDAKFPDAVAKELQRRCPGFLECDEELRNTLPPEGYTKRWKALLEWGENSFFSNIQKEGWFEAVAYKARAHPRSVRTVDYWVFYWDEHWSSGSLDGYPSFQEWRRAADDSVVGAGGERATAAPS
jgi:hypothetical protein